MADNKKVKDVSETGQVKKPSRWDAVKMQFNFVVANAAILWDEGLRNEEKTGVVGTGVGPYINVYVINNVPIQGKKYRVTLGMSWVRNAATSKIYNNPLIFLGDDEIKGHADITVVLDALAAEIQIRRDKIAAKVESEGIVE